MIPPMAIVALLRESRGTPAKKREDAVAKRGAAVVEADWIEVVKEWEKEKVKERREAMVRVEVARKGGGGGGERSEAEIAREGRAEEGVRGKETERGRRGLGKGLGFLRRRSGGEENRHCCELRLATCERVKSMSLVRGCYYKIGQWRSPFSKDLKSIYFLSGITELGIFS